MKTNEHLAGTKGETVAQAPAVSSFAKFTSYELRLFINGCHNCADYTEQFRAACLELNSRG